MHYLIVLLALAVITSGLRCACPKNEPICANDGITYSSKCVYDCVIDHKKHVLKEENPEKSFYIVDNKACPPKVKNELKDSIEYRCSCPRNMNPVCGSDNKTYDNDCILNCKANQVKELRKVRHGKCSEQNVFQEVHNSLLQGVKKIFNKISF